MQAIETISPIDGTVVVKRPFLSAAVALDAAKRSKAAQKGWRQIPLIKRIRLLEKAVDLLVEQKDLLAREITIQMGRPISQSPGELDGMAYRARHMLNIAQETLSDQRETAPDGHDYFMRRQPLGVVFAITPWNFPFMTAVNIVIPALAAGNSVLMKPSPQTPTVGEHFERALKMAGLPDDVFQCLHLDPSTTQQMIEHGEIDHVGFTGSTANGRAIEKAAAGRFLSVGLELGGKDAAYVRSDADLDYAIPSLVDGAFFNAGQSCCGIERIYVANPLYDRFVRAYVEKVKEYHLGHPQYTGTTLGPVVSVEAADKIRGQITSACQEGATALISDTQFPAAKPDTPYVAPQVLVDVDHDMAFMRTETFGPCVGIMPVPNDAEAVRLINDSPYGLTASIWTGDECAAMDIASELDVGTVYMNRCDALEPSLAWSGTKQSGRGTSLSRYGFDAVTRPKSFNLVHSV